MRNSKRTYKALAASVFVLMLTGCADDAELMEQGEKRVLSLMPYVSSYADASQKENARTRAKTVPTGYEDFTPAAGYGNIKVYLVHQKNGSWTCDAGGEFIYSSEGKWQSTATVDKSTQYYVYGYMPSSAASCAISSYSPTGATLTLSGLSVLNPVDVCAIVGVKKESESGDLTPGQYSYLTDATGNDNQLYLLFEHIYSKVDFQFAVDEDYNKLRTIKLKSVAMELPSATSTMTATVTLFNNRDLPMTTSFANGGGTSASQVTLLSTETALKTDYQSVPGYFLPGSNDLSFNLISTYDVYDMANNCVRQDCQAKNKISITAATAGYNYKVKLLVKPTYLYQLSEPDLDNPTITGLSPTLP